MCQVFGSATVLMGPPLVWEQADPEIHIPDDMSPDAVALLLEKYELGEQCDERSAHHARLKS